METELGSLWLPSQPRPDRWAMLPGQEEMPAHGFRETENKQQQTISHLFSEIIFPATRNGTYAVSLSTQFDLATKFKLFLVIISAFWDPIYLELYICKNNGTFTLDFLLLFSIF